MQMPNRAHVIAGGFPAGQPAGHDHDYARLRILQLLGEREIAASVSNDFVDAEKWLSLSRFLITYTAGPVLNDNQVQFVREWMEAGGRWLGLHGTSGGKAARIEGSRRRQMVRMGHHEALGGFFLSHPPVRRFNVDLADTSSVLTHDMPKQFEVIDEPYMIEVREPSKSRILLTAELGPDPMPGEFGFDYEKDTALMEDGKTRVIAYSRDLGEGGVTYVALGHCHTPATNSQPFVDVSVSPDTKTPPYLRQTWETDGFNQLLKNAMEWGLGTER
jgi:type 1 glutamine amidotransferase